MPAITTPTRTGIANLPLHYGKVPSWLFDRMVKLAREITIAIISDFGSEEMLRGCHTPIGSKLSAVFWATTGTQVELPLPCVVLSRNL